jgi:hypothetical protein
MTFLVVVYALGVLIGLVRTDAGPLARAGYALLWPLAIVAFAVTVAVLVLVALVALPFRGRRRSTAEA